MNDIRFPLRDHEKPRRNAQGTLNHAGFSTLPIPWDSSLSCVMLVGRDREVQRMIGERVGAWVIEKEVGRGGMGSVYRARAEPPAPNGPAVAAIKLISAELAPDPGFAQRFQREIDILRQLNHPNVVRFFEAGEFKGRS